MHRASPCRNVPVTFALGPTVNRLLIFRGLIVSFVLLYIAAIATGGLGTDAPALAVEYERWAAEQTQPSSIWGLLCAFGHLLDIAGLVLLFIRRPVGLWLLLAGFASCFGAGAGLPFLQTHFEAQLMALTNICWGALVCMAVVCRQELFSREQRT